MILYFSATGNTQYAASRIAEATEDTLISVRECIRNGKTHFHLKKNENFGLVMPTYFQGVPLFMKEFIESITLTADCAEHYTYAVSTCGVSYGNSGSEAVRAAQKAGIHLDATFCIHMVDNWNPYFNMTDKDYIQTAEENAEADLAKVCTQIASKEKGIYLEDSFDSKKEKELELAYEEARQTCLFAVNASCVGCGTCAEQCPVGAMKLQDQKPVWIKEKCLLCLGCVHKCPKNAIAYTEDTIGHGQYKNPHIETIR